MNDAVAHVTLSSKGHIGIMTSGLPSRNASGYLHQLQVWQLLECRGQVVCLQGMDGSLDPLLFDLNELLLWSTANMDEPTQDLPVIGMDLRNDVPEVPPPPEQKIHSAWISGEHWSSYSGLPLPPPLSLAVHHFQDTTAISAPGSSSPTREMENSPRSVGTEPIILALAVTHTLFSPGNPTQWLPWLCPIYSTTVLSDWAQSARGREHALHQAASTHFRRWTDQPI